MSCLFKGKILQNLPVTKGMRSLLLTTKLDKTLVVSNMCDALTYLLDNIFIRFGTNLYKQSVGILMGTNVLL